MIRITLLVTVLALVGCKKKPITPEAPTATTQAPVEGDAPVSGAEALASAAPAAPAQVDPQKTMDDAVALLTTGTESDARLALEALEKASKLDADSPELHYNMGVAWEILGDESSARKKYLRATDVDPKFAPAWLNLGALAEKGGSFPRALQNYRAGLKYSPEDPDLIVGVIGVLRKQGRHDDAEAEARTAIKRNANNINAYNHLGLVYLERGELDLAQFVYQRALGFIDGADGNALVHTNLGRVYLAQERSLLARSELDKALEIDPKDVAAMLAMSHIYLDNHDFGSTVTLLEAARELEPSNAAIHMNLGIAYRGVEKYAEAKASYERALELDDRQVDAYLNLSLLVGDHQKSYDDAIAYLDRYEDRGGPRVDTAAAFRAELIEQKELHQKAEERKARQEAARKKREARQKLAAEAKAKAAEEAEAEAKAAAEAAPPAPEPIVEPTPGSDSDGSSVNGDNPPGDAPAPEGAALAPVETGEAAGSSAAPAEGGGTASPDTNPATAAPDGADQSSAATPPGPAALVPSTVSAAAGAAALGQSCTAVGACGDVSLECATDGVCREAGSPGTYGAGVGCMAATDCAIGLACVSNMCAAGGAQSAPVPWGGGQ